jgi:hypothetical protein
MSDVGVKVKPFYVIMAICAIFCLSRCKTYKCGYSYVLMTYVGYQKSELDTIILRRYTQNDNFQTLLYSDSVTNSANNGGLGAGIYTISGDTTFVSINDNFPNGGIYAGYDWKIYLPRLGRTIIITNINSPQIDGNKKCVNPVNSFQINSLVVNSPAYFENSSGFTNGYRAIFIR